MNNNYNNCDCCKKHSQYEISGETVTVGFVKNFDENNGAVDTELDIQTGVIKTVTGQETDLPEYYKVGDKYLDLILQNPKHTRVFVNMSQLQDIYTAGEDIEIEGDVITNTGTKWGKIRGVISEQEDLSEILNMKADKSTLHALKSYSDEGELLTDEEGLNDVIERVHSTFDLSKFTVVGSPNITDDGIASGFSSSALSTPSINYGNSFVINFPAFKLDSVSTFQNLIGQYSGSSKSIGLGISSVAQLYCYLSSDGTTQYDIAEFYSDVNYIQANTWYYTRLSFNGTEYKLEISEDNENFVTLGTQQSGTKLFNSALAIGVGNLDGGTFYNELNGSIDLKQFSITVDGVEVFSGNKTGIDTIKPDNYAVVGTPVISADGIASGFSSSDYLTVNQNLGANLEINLRIKIPSTESNNQAIMYFLNSVNTDTLFFDSYGRLVLWSDGAIFSYELLSTFTVGDEVTIYMDFVNKLVKIYNETGALVDTVSISDTYTLFASGIRIGYQGSNGLPFAGSIDLNAFKIYVDGNLTYQPCLKIPYTESKTGSKVVGANYRERVKDMYNQFGFAPYYTLDEENGNFTLPMGEVYGLMGSQNLRQSSVSGINRKFLYSDRTQILTGSCTSGVEVTLNTPFADSNYMLSVPYSAKSATAFTSIQTGDWFAIGEGVL